jgi:predicted murein hydrolase (TIGR00659 family)
MMDALATVVDHPLFCITATIAAYGGATAIWNKCGAPAILHPVLVATAAVSLVLLLTGVGYETYFQQASLLNEALGVVIVLLAVPLSRHVRLIVEAGWPLAICLCVGSVVAIATALILPVLLGSSQDLVATLAPKSTTAAVAVEVSATLGGVPGLTAVVVIATGICGAMFGPVVLDRLGILDHRAKGFALGVASHAIGTARAFQISEVAGAFASLGMILNVLLTIALVPVAVRLLAS